MAKTQEIVQEIGGEPWVTFSPEALKAGVSALILVKGRVFVTFNWPEHGEYQGKCMACSRGDDTPVEVRPLCGYCDGS